MSNWTNNDELRYYSWFDYDTETHVILPLQDKVNLYQISPSFFFFIIEWTKSRLSYWLCTLRTFWAVQNQI